MTMQPGIFTRQRNLIALMYVVGMLNVSGNASADSIRFSDGQAYSAKRFKNFTLEGGYFGNDEGIRQGGRLTLPSVGNHFTLFADLTNNDGERTGIALGEPVEYSGNGEGAGVYIEGLPSWQNMALALRISRNIESADVDSNIAIGGRQAMVKLRRKTITVAMLMSPLKPMFNNGANGYLSIGVTQNRFTRTVTTDATAENRLNQREKDLFPYLAMGLSIPFGRVSFYGALVYEDDFTAGVGMRVLLNRTTRNQL